ncbi:MAG: hypothetical protein H7Z13_14230 [Ferruginibacter sp.]|nr:hypothetical protein [Ferruginibacter sp.]
MAPPLSNTIHTINSIINDLQTEGFVHTFSIIADEIGCSGPRKLYKPAEIKIVKQNNYQANPYSSSGAIIYALETNDGFKGVLINRCGIYADEAIERFIQRASA